MVRGESRQSVGAVAPADAPRSAWSLHPRHVAGPVDATGPQPLVGRFGARSCASMLADSRWNDPTSFPEEFMKRLCLTVYFYDTWWNPDVQQEQISFVYFFMKLQRFSTPFSFCFDFIERYFTCFLKLFWNCEKKQLMILSLSWLFCPLNNMVFFFKIWSRAMCLTLRIFAEGEVFDSHFYPLQTVNFHPKSGEKCYLQRF